MARPPSGTARFFSPRRPNWPRALSAELRNSLAVIRVPSAARRRRPPRMHPRRTKCIAPPKRTESTPTAFSFPLSPCKPDLLQFAFSPLRADADHREYVHAVQHAQRRQKAQSLRPQHRILAFRRPQPASAICIPYAASNQLAAIRILSATATSPLQTPGAAVCMKPPRPHSKIYSPRANHSSSLHALSALKPFGICLIPINMQFLGTKSSLELQISPLFALFSESQNPRLGCAVSARRAYPSPCSLPRGRPPARRHCAPAPAARWFQ